MDTDRQTDRVEIWMETDRQEHRRIRTDRQLDEWIYIYIYIYTCRR